MPDMFGLPPCVRSGFVEAVERFGHDRFTSVCTERLMGGCGHHGQHAVYLRVYGAVRPTETPTLSRYGLPPCVRSGYARSVTLARQHRFTSVCTERFLLDSLTATDF